ncbi:glycosyltransferase [Xinfangfangia sp. D13-10-4-6]|uniref:glycosyltransferase family 4 protein n=1 Tax=Pseudogemmobacter hezensis TaxID=2737662 RepID=UPI001551B6FA|nr:glycosyltransferase [Pseudogemmobacter hezensis]NPD14028.1 glycosyltransferase [Pseudogemmobacter hezensis]
MTQPQQNAPIALPSRLRQRYMLSVLIPYYRDRNGAIWLGRLWAHDLRAHLDYLGDLTILAPEVQIDQPGPDNGADLVRFEVPPGVNLRFRPYGKAGGGALRALLALPARAIDAWAAVGQADIVHSGVAGWPLPPGLLLNPIAVLRRRPLIIVIESAFWRLPDPAQAGWKARLRASLTERFARWSLRRARLGIYTSQAYRQSLPVGPGGEALVLSASWISDEMILSEAEAGASWAKKLPAPQGEGGAVRFLMASRLVSEKGIGLFLAALQELRAQGIAARIDVIGEGPMRADLQAFADRPGPVMLRLLDPVEYGPPFMRLLQSYHAVIVPTTGDEQPRILFDAFAQAVPVLATGTSGNLEVVTDGATGIVVAPGGAHALAEGIIRAQNQPERLHEMGLMALETARTYTHATMHQRRAEVLRHLFADPATAARQGDHEGLS